MLCCCFKDRGIRPKKDNKNTRRLAVYQIECLDFEQQKAVGTREGSRPSDNVLLASYYCKHQADACHGRYFAELTYNMGGCMPKKVSCTSHILYRSNIFTVDPRLVLSCLFSFFFFAHALSDRPCFQDFTSALFSFDVHMHE